MTNIINNSKPLVIKKQTSSIKYKPASQHLERNRARCHCHSTSLEKKNRNIYI